jgi:hypothetical protein
MSFLIDGLRGRVLDTSRSLRMARAEPKSSIEGIMEHMRFAGVTIVTDLSGAGTTVPRMCCIHYAEDAVDSFAEEGWRVTSMFTVGHGTLCAIMEIRS